MQRSESSVIVCERIARVENCPAQELLFSEWRARNMARRFFFILVLSTQSVRQKKDAPCYARPIHGKGALALGQFSTRAILSHTMTGNRQKVVERV